MTTVAAYDDSFHSKRNEKRTSEMKTKIPRLVEMASPAEPMDYKGSLHMAASLILLTGLGMKAKHQPRKGRDEEAHSLRAGTGGEPYVCGRAGRPTIARRN